MPKSAAHYFKDGTRFTGATHKMPNGEIHSGARHGRNSERVFHFADLTNAAKLRARKK
jgi:hypothetical protein